MREPILYARGCTFKTRERLAELTFSGSRVYTLLHRMAQVVLPLLVYLSLCVVVVVVCACLNALYVYVLFVSEVVHAFL